MTEADILRRVVDDILWQSDIKEREAENPLQMWVRITTADHLVDVECEFFTVEAKEEFVALFKRDGVPPLVALLDGPAYDVKTGRMIPAVE